MVNKKTLGEIEIDYISSLKIPENKPAKQIFFCPVGLVGAGKTTITKPIAERMGLLRLSSDELRKILKENGHDYSPVKDMGFKIAKDFAHKGFSIAFDLDCSNIDSKNFIEDLAADLKAEIIWVHIKTPESHIFEKFRKHPPTWLADNPQMMIDNYNSQKEKRARENTHFDFFMTFDTSKDDVSGQIEEGIKRIQYFLKSLD